MYRSYLQEKFPQDDTNGLFVVPQLPAKKLGKILIKETQISSPNDVVALHLDEGTFRSSYIVFTQDRCYHDGGAFLLEDVKDVQVSGTKLIVFANQKGQYLQHELSAKNATAAKTLERIFEGIRSFDPKSQAMVERTYEGFSNTELDWLNLRDEIMRTIDMLYDRFMEGKLSLVEYEDKKADLMSRL